jgi:hypothetical protein
LKIAPLAPAALVAMPMLLAFSKNRVLSWRPAGALLAAVLCGCAIQAFLPGYTAERPRGMSLMYSEVAGGADGYLALDSQFGRTDENYARAHGFRPEVLRNGRLGTVERLARKMPALGLPGAVVRQENAVRVDDGWFRTLRITPPKGARFLSLTVPGDAGLASAWVAGQLALDHRIAGKHSSARRSVAIFYPGEDEISVDLLTASPNALEAALMIWQELPPFVAAPFLGNWPDNARARQRGPRAERIQVLELPAAPPD